MKHVIVYREKQFNNNETFLEHILIYLGCLSFILVS